MKELIERFYNSIRLRGEPPIPYREIILTARIMDEIFSQIYRDGERQPGDGQHQTKGNECFTGHFLLITHHSRKSNELRLDHARTQ